jgi:hypothetical protein
VQGQMAPKGHENPAQLMSLSGDGVTTELSLFSRTGRAWVIPFRYLACSNLQRPLNHTCSVRAERSIRSAFHKHY